MYRFINWWRATNEYSWRFLFPMEFVLSFLRTTREPWNAKKAFETDRKLFTDEYRYRLYGWIKGNTETLDDSDTRVCYHGNYICVERNTMGLFALFDCASSPFVFFHLQYTYIYSIVYAFRRNSVLLWNRGNLNANTRLE